MFTNQICFDLNIFLCTRLKFKASIWVQGSDLDLLVDYTSRKKVSYAG